MKFRKKPVVIEAFVWTGKLNSFETIPWANEAFKNTTIWFDKGEMFITTLEGNHKADINDYVIQGVKGEIYPCKPDIFKMTYDEVADDETK